MTNIEYLETIAKLEYDDCMDYAGYYNGYSLLRTMDLDDNMPEIFLCAGNRTAGKTFFFKRFLVRFALYTGNPFLMLTRKRTQLYTASKSFISDLDDDISTFKHNFSIENSDSVGVKEIYYNGSLVGYVSYLNYADDIKEASNMFNKVSWIFKDEFQQPNDNYVNDELSKFRSIHKSCARGFGETTRYLPTILCSNQISIINPYYVALGIHRRISHQTKRMRGKGWVLQVTFNENASRAAKGSSFEMAFGEDKQSLSDNQNVYMDNLNLVEKISTSKMTILFVFVVNKESFGVWCTPQYYYISTRIDKNCKRRYAMDLESHDESTILIQKHDILFIKIRQYFERGLIRFQDISCKVAIIDALATTIL